MVILGILAAIVVPQFTRAADEARNGNIATQISTLENQFELFRAREGAYPDLVADQWVTMIADEYIKDAPVNPVDQSSLVSAAAGSGGWVYTQGTGTITADGAP